MLMSTIIMKGSNRLEIRNFELIVFIYLFVKGVDCKNLM